MRVADRQTARPAPVTAHRVPSARTVLIALVCSLLAAAVSAGVTVAVVSAPEPGEWRQVFREDFDTPVPVGQFPGTVYGDSFTVYPDGWADTNGRGEYRPSDVLSVADGSLVFDMRMDGGKMLGAAVLPTLPTYGQTFGEYSLRFRAESTSAGYGIAFLLWPDSEKWPRDGEIDFPEGDLDGDIYGYAHHAGQGGEVEKFETGASFNAWHTATIRWRPGSVRMLLDGNLIGESTKGVPSRSMHWVLQSGGSGDAEPREWDVARVEVDWLEAFAWQGSGS